MNHGPHPARTAALATLTLALTVGFLALGWWQLERRVWKLGLIDRVEARISAPPVAPPEPSDWAVLTRQDSEYRRIGAVGRFGPGQARVQAVTEAGPGYWVLSPFTLEDGTTVLVNRGFVPSRDLPVAMPQGPQRITGLLRLTEPEGGFLRANDPGRDRWYSRDVAAIAEAMGIGPVAPYFIDAEAGANGGTPPMGGLTVVTFRNSHLVYALTWFALAAMGGGATIIVLRAGRTSGAAERSAT